jgi:hypothetical protein
MISRPIWVKSTTGAPSWRNACTPPRNVLKLRTLSPVVRGCVPLLVSGPKGFWFDPSVPMEAHGSRTWWPAQKIHDVTAYLGEMHQRGSFLTKCLYTSSKCAETEDVTPRYQGFIPLHVSCPKGFWFHCSVPMDAHGSRKWWPAPNIHDFTAHLGEIHHRGPFLTK